jgi:hypothetical protein
MDLQDLANQVKRNCDISDAKYWGVYSVCGLLLRMREFYKWEMGLEPWAKIDTFKLMEWMDSKEKKWKQLAGEKFSYLVIDGRKFKPFDVDGVNEVLKPHGVVYGAGYVRGMKPSFFLAELLHSEQRYGYNIYFLGRELAKDIATSPALTQDKNIFARKEMMRSFLWNKIEEFKYSRKSALKYAFKHYHLDPDNPPEEIISRLEDISSTTLELMLHHEIGEAIDNTFPEKYWREIIASFPGSPIERLARGIRDVLADTTKNGTLDYIIQREDKGSLGFFVSSITGLREALFPEIIPAFWNFRKKEDWNIVERARDIGYNNAKSYAKKMVEIYKNGATKGRSWITSAMKEELLQPLGI